MARKDRLSEVFSGEAAAGESGRLPAGNPVAKGSRKPAPFGLNRYAAEHLQKPNARYIQEIDPELIERGGPADRMDELDEAAEAALRESISRTGQTTPVLLRPDPEHPGRFRIIYGRRRVRAIRSLGQKVKAIIRDDITDEDAVIIQGQENSVRKDLSFLERARFLIAIEAEGFPRAVAIDALAIDKARASNYAKLGKTLPDSLARLIGPAPGIGRDRWLAFVSAYEGCETAFERIEAALTAPRREAADSDARFGIAFEALAPAAKVAPEKPAPSAGDSKMQIGLGEGKDRKVFATVKTAKGAISVSVPAKTDAQKSFADHLSSRIEDLIREELDRWQKTGGRTGD
ncbi:plasmid partitioning protein RepB [Mangrovicoccus ximenensis]|uniref:plasmid partitioning protein RepB n=1 Tax=Mangrovicoccus ximenensis TaxID=1911570 RepID=UPI000D39777C|nr:plasmid partitioning protein RepB [Mangrovicoccus ximenensis]